jgi:hypothetical protein
MSSLSENIHQVILTTKNRHSLNEDDGRSLLISSWLGDRDGFQTFYEPINCDINEIHKLLDPDLSGVEGEAQCLIRYSC